MLIRVQHVDGTLEPPVAVGALIGESEELLDEIGTTFALPDGRWVRVLGFERESDGSIRYGVVGELPERRTYSATGNEAYVRDAGEMRMGSPAYGTLMLDGSPLEVAGFVDEASLVWSQDGHFLAATAQDPEQPFPWLKVIVIDVQSREVVGASGGQPDLGTPVRFVGRGVEYLEWCPDPDYPGWVGAYFPY